MPKIDDVGAGKAEVPSVLPTWPMCWNAMNLALPSDWPARRVWIVSCGENRTLGLRRQQANSAWVHGRGKDVMRARHQAGPGFFEPVLALFEIKPAETDVPARRESGPPVVEEKRATTCYSIRTESRS